MGQATPPSMPASDRDTLAADALSAAPDSDDADDSLDRALLELAAAPSIDVGPRLLEPGTVIDESYRIERRLGSGGMGVVYLATDLDLDRPVAIKLRPGEASASQLARLWREARVMARLSHPNVIAVYDVGTYRGMLFIAMEYLDGGTASTWVEAKPRTWSEIVAFYVQAGRGLAAAHRVGVVHRDFKPDNVLVASDGRVRVADFGLAQAAGTEPQPADVPSPPSIDAKLTQTGATLGTPAYMAPEQFIGADVSAAADQFTFCVALFEALYGTRPFRGDTLPELMQCVSAGVIATASPSTPVPAWIRETLRRGLSAEPADRYPDMDALLAALTDDPNAKRRRWIVRGGAVAVAGVAAVLAYMAGSRGPQCTDGRDEIAAVWNDDVRAAIASAFARSDVPLAADVSARVDRELDAYAESWAAAHALACQDTHVRGEQSAVLLDRRMACLDRRRAAFSALVDVLARADDRAVENALEAASGLPPVDACADTVALQAEVDPPAANERARVDAARALIDDASAMIAAGQVEEAIALADTAVAEARECGYPPVLAEALRVHAAGLQAYGQGERARASFSEAYFIAVAAGHDRVAREAALGLVEIESTHGDALSEALLWAANAVAIGERLGNNREHAAEVAMARGNAYLTSSKHADARAEFELCLGISESPLLRARATTGLAVVAGLEGSSDVALQRFRDVVETMREVYGEQHWEVARALQGLATATAEAGDVVEAERLFETVIAMFEASLGPDTPHLVEALNRAAGVARKAGDLERSLAIYERALALRNRVQGDRPETEINLLANIGSVALQLGDGARATEYGEASLAAAEKAFGADHWKTAAARLLLSNAYRRTGRDSDGLRQLELAVAGLESTLGPTSPNLLMALLNLASMRAELGDHEGAGVAIARAEEVVRVLHHEEHMHNAMVAHARATVEVEQSNHRGAEQAYARCAEIVARVIGPNHPERAKCLHWRGVAVANLGEDTDAIVDAALATFRNNPALPPDLAVRILAASAKKARAHRDDATADALTDEARANLDHVDASQRDDLREELKL